MIQASLLLLAAATPIPNAAAAPNAAEAASLQAAHDYGSCVGMTAVLNSATTSAIEEAIRAAFDRCSAKREAALTAVISSLEGHGLSAARATQVANQMIHENEQLMADRLKADIATFRQTGQPPTDASN